MKRTDFEKLLNEKIDEVLNNKTWRRKQNFTVAVGDYGLDTEILVYPRTMKCERNDLAYLHFCVRRKFIKTDKKFATKYFNEMGAYFDLEDTPANVSPWQYIVFSRALRNLGAEHDEADTFIKEYATMDMTTEKIETLYNQSKQ